MISKNHKISSQMTKPTSKTNLTPITNLMLVGAGIGAGTVILDESDKNYTQSIISKSNEISNHKSQVNLIEFSRLYTIGQIPIIDFIVIYILLYIVNHIYLKFDYKYILIATIPIVICFNLITNKNLKISWGMLVVLFGCMYLLYIF